MMPPLRSETQYHDQIFEALQMDRARIESSGFIDCQFVRCSLIEAELHNCRFQCSKFTGCDLSLADATGSELSSVQFEECKLVGVDWTKLASNQPTLGKPLSFKSSILNHGTFIGMPLKGMQVIECVAHEVDFREADLSETSFSGTDLLDSLFNETNLRAADLRLARNYHINPETNTLSDARFSLPEAMSLLYAMDIRLDQDENQS
jgi:fluoroquinolone resistance protein